MTRIGYQIPNFTCGFDAVDDATREIFLSMVWWGGSEKWRRRCSPALLSDEQQVAHDAMPPDSTTSGH
jgi:hypothetical protein